jgi:hypothetical protein
MDVVEVSASHPGTVAQPQNQREHARSGAAAGGRDAKRARLGEFFTVGSKS